MKLRWLTWIRDHEAALWLVGFASLLMLLASLLITPIIVARLPPDYFIRPRRPRSPWRDQRVMLRTVLIVLKNALGLALLAAGLAMLLLPGQGLLTIFLGVLLMDFPGKFRIQRWMIQRRAVHRPINWIRRRAGRPPLIVDAPPQAGDA